MGMIVGLTGGIGCGKSSVSKGFAALGVPIVDTDRIAHALTGTGGLAVREIADYFGAEYLGPDGALNRPRMRELVFNDSAAKTRLEAILHPLIYREAVLSIDRHRSAAYSLLVVPLLLETQSYLPLIDRILVVDCATEQQISRTMTRSGLDETTVVKIMQQQLSRSDRLQHADDVILNHAHPSFIQQQIIELDQLYTRLGRDRHDTRPKSE